MADLRLGELRSALGHLTGSQDIAIKRLSQPDGRTGSADLARIDCGSLERFARERGTSVIWSTWQEDPHCDHEAAATLAGRLADRLNLPMWSFAVWGRFGDRPVTGLAPQRFEPGGHLDAKRRAVAAYRSQTTNMIADDPTGFIMPPAIVDHFINAPELFFERR